MTRDEISNVAVNGILSGYRLPVVGKFPLSSPWRSSGPQEEVFQSFLLIASLFFSKPALKGRWMVREMTNVPV